MLAPNENQDPSDDFDQLTINDDDGSDLCNLFVGDLSRTANEDMVREVFSRHGTVLAVDIKRDKVTNNNLGYGFVQYQTRKQAEDAKEALHGVEIGGRRIRLGWAQKNTTLFVGDLDGAVSTATLKEIFSKFGTLVDEETFVKADTGRFGFVRFRHRADAEHAKAEMNGKIIGSRSVRIGWGDNNVQKHCVHVQFNANEAQPLDEADLRGLFEQFGPVASVSLPRFPNGQLKGYGFAHFEDSAEGEKVAATAIGALGGQTTLRGVAIRCSYGKKQVNRRRHHTFQQPHWFGEGVPPPPGMGMPWLLAPHAYPYYPYPPPPPPPPPHLSPHQREGGTGLGIIDQQATAAAMAAQAFAAQYYAQPYYPHQQVYFDPNFGTYVQGYPAEFLQYQQYYDQAAAHFLQLEPGALLEEGGPAVEGQPDPQAPVGANSLQANPS